MHWAEPDGTGTPFGSDSGVKGSRSASASWGWQQEISISTVGLLWSYSHKSVILNPFLKVPTLVSNATV